MTNTIRKKLLLAGLTGILLTAAFPKIEIYWAAWFALIPLLWAIQNQSFKSSFFLGFFAGSIHYTTLLYWVTHSMQYYGNIPLPICVLLLLLLSVYCAVYTGIYTALVSRCQQSRGRFILFSTALWTALEFLRTYLFTGFPWGLLGYSQFHNLQVIQIADLAGVYGVTALIVFTNSALFFLCKEVKHILRQENNNALKAILTPVCLIIIIHTGVYIYGSHQLDTINHVLKKSNYKKIALIQGNIDQSAKWDKEFKRANIEKYLRLSAKAAELSPDIIVWPETAIPAYFSIRNPLIQTVLKEIETIQRVFLVGCPSYLKFGENLEFFNSAYLIDEKGVVKGKYDKFHLVPFGEYVPLRKWFPFLGKMVEQIGDFSTGLKGQTILWNDHHIGVQICFEIIFPELSRAAAKNQADIIFNITNDAWFGKTAGPYQHFAMVVFRAVENRISVARAANTGISGYIWPTGIIKNTTVLNETKMVMERVPLIRFSSLYSRFGDIFAIGCLLISGICILTFTKMRRKKNE